MSDSVASMLNVALLPQALVSPQVVALLMLYASLSWTPTSSGTYLRSIAVTLSLVS